MVTSPPTPTHLSLALCLPHPPPTDKEETKLKGVIYFQAIEEVYYDHLRCAFKVKPLFGAALPSWLEPCQSNLSLSPGEGPPTAPIVRVLHPAQEIQTGHFTAGTKNQELSLWLSATVIFLGTKV